MVFYSNRFNPGIYLAVLFYQLGKIIAQFVYPVGKKEWLGTCLG